MVNFEVWRTSWKHEACGLMHEIEPEEAKVCGGCLVRSLTGSLSGSGRG